MCDTFEIKGAASSALRKLGRTSLSGEGFTDGQIDAISEAIAAAIAEYDRQNPSKES